MHILQSEHSRLDEKETEELLLKLNVSKTQLPKILLTDTSLPKDSNIGDIIKISRKDGNKIHFYFRVVV